MSSVSSNDSTLSNPAQEKTPPVPPANAQVPAPVSQQGAKEEAKNTGGLLNQKTTQPPPGSPPKGASASQKEPEEKTGNRPNSNVVTQPNLVVPPISKLSESQLSSGAQAAPAVNDGPGGPEIVDVKLLDEYIANNPDKLSDGIQFKIGDRVAAVQIVDHRLKFHEAEDSKLEAEYYKESEAFLIKSSMFTRAEESYLDFAMMARSCKVVDMITDPLHYYHVEGDPSRRKPMFVVFETDDFFEMLENGDVRCNYPPRDLSLAPMKVRELPHMVMGLHCDISQIDEAQFILCKFAMFATDYSCYDSLGQTVHDEFPIQGWMPRVEILPGSMFYTGEKITKSLELCVLLTRIRATRTGYSISPPTFVHSGSVKSMEDSTIYHVSPYSLLIPESKYSRTKIADLSLELRPTLNDGFAEFHGVAPGLISVEAHAQALEDAVRSQGIPFEFEGLEGGGDDHGHYPDYRQNDGQNPNFNPNPPDPGYDDNEGGDGDIRGDDYPNPRNVNEDDGKDRNFQYDLPMGPRQPPDPINIGGVDFTCLCNNCGLSSDITIQVADDYI